MRLKEYEKSYKVRFANGITVEILKRGGEFGGLGQVTLRRRKLRSAELPIMPLVRTPDGYEVSHLRFRDVRQGEESLTIDLTPFVRPCGRMEWVGDGGCDRWNVSAWEQPAERDRGGLMQVVLRAVSRRFADVEFTGFSYAYKFRSRRFRACRIHDRATWELGGRATGNSFWMRGPFNEPERTFLNKNDSYSTAGRRPGSPQFLPFFSALQGFTFQFDRRSLLVATFDAPFHCRSLFQKDAGSNCLVHWHQLCDDLSGSLEFPALQVLCAPSPGGDRADRMNCYCAVRQALGRQYAEQRGLVREGMPAGSVPTADGQQSAEAIRHCLDELARAGCTRVYAPGLIAGPAASGRSTAKPGADGQRRARRFVEHAHRRGLEVAASLEDCCAPLLLGDEASDVPDGHAGATAIDGPLACALHDPAARRRVLEHLQELRKSVGVDVLFADGALASARGGVQWTRLADGDEAHSAGAARAAGRDRADQVRSLHKAMARLVTDLQSIGYKCLPAGLDGLGTAPVRAPYRAVRDSEFMFRDCVLDFPAEGIADAGDEPLVAYFRACANRVSYVAACEFGRTGSSRIAGWWRPGYAVINKAYQAVREHMEASHHLPDGRGVVWVGGDPEVSVFWCYKAFCWPMPQSTEVFDVAASRRVELADAVFQPAPLRVYLLQNAEGI